MKTFVLSLFFFTFAKNKRKRMKRERNFEVLRTVAMFFIVVYHSLTHGVGGEYEFDVSHPIMFSNVLFSDFLLVISSIAVNLYVMISGFFLVDLNFRLSRIVRTWTCACFYSFMITLFFMIMHIIPCDIVLLSKSIFPISTDAYWFVTQYIGLLILSPFLAMIVRSLTYRQYLFLLIGGAFMCLALVPDFPLAKRYHVAHGNSVWSFAYLFLVAGFVKHHLHRIPKNHLLITVLLITLLIIGEELYSGYNNGNLHLYWLDYNSLPFVLTIIVFLYVRQVKIPERGYWNVFIKAAPYTFGVYLIHDHLLVRDSLWSLVSLTSYCDKYYFPLIIIGLCVILFIVCSMIDALRMKIFALFKIGDFIAKVDKWLP